ATATSALGTICPGTSRDVTIQRAQQAISRPCIGAALALAAQRKEPTCGIHSRLCFSSSCACSEVSAVTSTRRSGPPSTPLHGRWFAVSGQLRQRHRVDTDGPLIVARTRCVSATIPELNRALESPALDVAPCVLSSAI